MSVPEAPEKTDDALRRALDELQRANDCFRVIVEFLPVPIAITRKATGKVMYANDHFAALYGLTRSSGKMIVGVHRSEEHTSELQSHLNLVCRLLLEKKK